MSFSVVPRGTGVANNRAQFSVFNTDLVASPTNYEFASLRARGSDFVFATGKGGTGVNRPVMFASGYLSDNTTNNGQLYLASNGNVGVGTTNPTTKLDVVGNINTTTQYNIGGNRILTNAGLGNLLAGVDAGNLNTGVFNSFFGASAGKENLTGSGNSFFGFDAGGDNTTGVGNSFFGLGAGGDNLTGNSNSFFGANAGASSLDAGNNSFFGSLAGAVNTSGSENAFFGAEAGRTNELGGRNSFFGYKAGRSNRSGARNSFFGYEAGMSSTGQDNSFFGEGSGRLNTSGIRNSFFGTDAGENTTTGDDNVFIGKSAGSINTTGSSNTVIGANTNLAFSNLNFVTLIGAGAELPNQVASNSVTIGRSNDAVFVPGSLQVFDEISIGGIRAQPVARTVLHVGGRTILDEDVTINGEVTLNLNSFGLAGNDKLCHNANDEIAFCSSSLRYKTDIAPLKSGLNLVSRLRPITFTWKNGGKRDVGLGAEEVEKIDPLLVTYNTKGQVEGVKYDGIAVVLLNAVKEQQSLITKQDQQLKQQLRVSLEQRRQLEQQQQQLDALRKLVCKRNSRARACR